jgi:hypothetical protein
MRQPSTADPAKNSALGRAGVAQQSWLLTLAASALIVTIGRVGPDWPAQEFRSWFARNVGLRAWSDAWYAGHALPGYSVLFPPLSAVLGAGITGLLAATVCAWAGCRFAAVPGRPLTARSAIAVNLAIALCVLGNLVLGQIPFLLGTAFGLCALLTLRVHRPRSSVALAGACSLASPLSGFFLLLVGVGVWRENGWRRAWPLSTAALGSLVAALVGGSSGTFPFDVYSAAGISAFTVLGWLLIPRPLIGLRWFLGANAVAAVAVAAIPNAIGGNLTRLDELIAVPLALGVFGVEDGLAWTQRWIRPAVFAICIAASAVWQIEPVVSAVARSAGDPSENSSYYTGLLGFLATQNPTAGRLEIPFTREHWEAAYVAPHFPLTRGWERQLDVEYNDVLYHPLTASSYRAWLDASAVDLVALPKAPIDYGGVAERALLAHPPSYLSVVYRDHDWTVYRVLHPTPLLSGADARLLRLGASSFTVQFREPGTATIRLHASTLWRPDSSTACLDQNSDGWVHLRVTHPETVTVKAQVTLGAVLQLTPDACDDD